ncbi:winged helix-turn-helix transcriptional regulator [Planomonospora sp. ID91781]|uniref:winged helix-turn-helix transcriptional regulator n=1 Tax=Planomonospora sp. ID91781 TaxID=2738135 RepID=UPI001E30D190|nr:winged helix-turn-helix transcriptional regulator [Planomonospora sp. ID91781]
MNEARWRMVVDREGVTIAGDRFRLTAARPSREEAGVVPDEADALFAEIGPLESIVDMESILSELQTVTRGSYGQFCGLSRALEMVGERWVLLIVRDLFTGPKSLPELRRGLPRIPAATLDVRLRELERTGVVRRLPAGTEDGGAAQPAVYELTEYGRQLERAVIELSRWGARSLGEPRPEDVVTVNSMIMALRTTFRPEAARGLTAGYELRLGGMVLHARVEDGVLSVGEGALPGADLVIEPGPVLRALMAGELDPAEAIESGSLRIVGDPALMTRFVEIFTFRPEPSLVGS